MNGDIDSLNEEIGGLNGEINSLTNRKNGLEKRIDEYKALATFVDKHLVFVENKATPLYHKYGCYKFNKKKFFWCSRLKPQ